MAIKNDLSTDWAHNVTKCEVHACSSYEKKILLTHLENKLGCVFGEHVLIRQLFAKMFGSEV